MSASVSRRNVEPIVRAVLAASGLDLTLLRADAMTDGWRVTIKDVADRSFSVELPGCAAGRHSERDAGLD
jgi:hypothetical protein